MPELTRIGRVAAKLFNLSMIQAGATPESMYLQGGGAQSIRTLINTRLAEAMDSIAPGVSPKPGATDLNTRLTATENANRALRGQLDGLTKQQDELTKRLSNTEKKPNA